jgi:hypothetical protein
MKRTLFGW